MIVRRCLALVSQSTPCFSCSPDLTSWTYHGLALKTWPTYPYGTQFTPWAVYDSTRHRFGASAKPCGANRLPRLPLRPPPTVLWWNDYEHGCCSGGFATATSSDGIHFDVANLDIPSVYPSVDCNSVGGRGASVPTLSTRVTAPPPPLPPLLAGIHRR